MDCLRDVQNVLKRTEASTCCQILASYITNFQQFSFIPLQQPGPRLTGTVISNIYRDWETFGKHLEHVLHILLPCTSRLISILCYCPFYFLGLILIASRAF